MDTSKSGWSYTRAPQSARQAIAPDRSDTDRSGKCNDSKAPAEPGWLLSLKASAGCDSGVALVGDDPGPLTVHAYWIAGEQQLKKKPPLVAGAATPAVNCNSSSSIFSTLAFSLATASCGDAAVSSGAGSTTSLGVGSSAARSSLAH